MTEVEAIEDRIRNLPQQDFASLQAWFHEFENELWDRQIAADSKAGKFDNLIIGEKYSVNGFPGLSLTLPNATRIPQP